MSILFYLASTYVVKERNRLLGTMEKRKCTCVKNTDC